MAGDSYDDMEPPPRPHRADRDTRDPDGEVQFESQRESMVEDSLRARMIGEAIEQYPHLFGIEAVDLMHRLQEGVETRIAPQTPASSLYMRQIRIRVIGHLWALLEDES